MEATIFNIQRYSLHDGGGIRTIVFFKGCPFTCPWCANPEGLSLKPQILYKEKLCIHCCAQVNNRCNKTPDTCPSGALEIAGTIQSVEDVYNQVIRDKVFYDTSNGGVTLSGGECLLQQDFVIELLKKLKDNGIHTAIETTMALPINDMDTLVKYTDLFLIDLKIMNKEKAMDILHMNMDLYKKNITELQKRNAQIIIRIPLIPTYTSIDDNIHSIIDYMLDIGLDTVHLLPFHKLGEAKYKSLNKEYSLYDLQPLSDAEIKRIQVSFETNGIKTVVGGN